MTEHALPVHPRTGLAAVGIVNGRPVWPILGGSGEGDDGGTDDNGTDAATYTPPASQDDLNRIIEDRLARERKKYGATPDEVTAWREAAGRLDALELELASDTEKATRQAADQSWSAAMAAAVPRIVRAEFRAEAKGILTDDQLDGLLEDVDLTRYADDDGEPDVEKIKAKIEKVAPQSSSHVNGRPTQVNPSLGQGKRTPAALKPGDAGRAQAAKRFGDKAAATT